MTTTLEELKRRNEQLVEELKHIPEFRKGTVNTFYRKCGRNPCVCNKKGHPGHGPQTTLTFKEDGKTKTRTFPTAAVEELARQQVENRRQFLDWSKRWKELNEQISDHKLEEVLSGKESKNDTPKKKPRERSLRRSGGRSMS
jgi:hypothetical protein